MEKIVQILLSFATGLVLVFVLVKTGLHPENWQFWAIFFLGGLLMGLILTKILRLR